MTISFIADVHVGNHKVMGGPSSPNYTGINRRCEQILDVLKKAVFKSSNLIVLGDLFDTANPSPQILSHVMELFNTEKCLSIITGNHDVISNKVDDNALAPLRVYGKTHEIGVLDVFDTDIGVVELGFSMFYLVPFSANLYDTLDKVAKLVESNVQTDKRRVLCFHAGISDDDTPPWLKNSKNSIEITKLVEYCKKNGFNAAIAGDWHERRIWKVDDVAVMQVGALVPTGFDNPGLDGYGTLAKYDEELNIFGYEEIAGPRFLTVNYGEPCTFASRKSGLINKVYLRVLAQPDQTSSALEWLNQRKKEKLVQDGEIKVVKPEAKSFAKDVVNSVRSVDQVIDNYISSLNLPSNITKFEIMDLVKKYYK